MTRGRNAWRSLGTTLAVLVLAVIAFSPGIERLICHDDGSPAAAGEQWAGVVQADDAHDDHEDGDCVHGHCHHASAWVPLSLAVSKEPAAHPLPSGAPPPVRLPVSNLQFDLMRPPRA